MAQQENTTTGLGMCELIARYLKDTQGVMVDPRAIWQASPHGELAHVFEGWWVARAYYGMYTHEALPEAGIGGEVAIVPDGQESALYLWHGGGWQKMQTVKRSAA